MGEAAFLSFNVVAGSAPRFGFAMRKILRRFIAAVFPTHR